MLHTIKKMIAPAVLCLMLLVSGCAYSTTNQSSDGEALRDTAGPEMSAPGGDTADPSDVPSQSDSPTPIDLHGEGNTPSNLLVGGTAAEYDGYVYHVDSMMWGDIWRTPVDGGAGELLQKGMFFDLNVNSGAIFTLGSAVDPATGNNADGIYRMNIDGSDMQMVKEGYFAQLVLYDEYLYYSDFDGVLYRIKYDGSDETVLSEGWVDNFTIIDGVLYLYAELDEEYEMNIYKMPLDASAAPEMVVQDTFGGAIYAAKEFIYFLPRSNETSDTYRYNTATGETSAFTSAWVDYVNTDGTYLYYFWNGVRADGDDMGVYRCHLDGSDAQLLMQTDMFFDPNIAGGRIYWSNNDEQRRLNVMNLDGSDRGYVEQAQD